MTRTLAAIAASAAVLWAAPAMAVPAVTYTIDFESFAEGDQLDGLVDFGGGLTGFVVTDRNDGADAPATICSTVSGSICVGNDPDLLSPFTGVGESAGDPDVSPGNVLIAPQPNGDVNDDADGASFTFSGFSVSGLRLVSALFLDTDDDGGSGAEIWLDGVVAASLLGNKTAFGGGDNEYERAVFGQTPFTELKVVLPGSGALGDLVFAAPAPITEERIPLPAAAWMLLAGVGGLAGLRARRRR
jgi:hypothetical protein